MERLNLALDADTLSALRQMASARNTAVAPLARELLRKVVAWERATERHARRAADHAEGANDPEEREAVLDGMVGADELLSREEYE